MKWFLAILLIPSAVIAADVCPRCKTEIVVDDISGGLYTSLPSYKIPKQFSPYMRNTIIDNGKMEKPGGFKAVGSTNTLSSGQGIFPFYQETGDTSFLVTDSSVTLFTKDWNTYTFVSSGTNANVLLRCKQIRNKMWCTNGVDPVFTWDGTSKVILDGTNGTPNVPRGKYIEYYQDRVFTLNEPGAASQSHFSDTRSTNGVQIAPDNFLAWPGANLLNIGAGDGQIGTAMWVENQLQYGKEASIYSLFGQNASNYNPQKTANFGVASQDSVVIQDGDVHFLGNDGIYREKTRISDKIADDVRLINKDTTKIQQNLWDTPAQFSRGQFFGSTVTADGLLKPYTRTKSMTGPDIYGSNNTGGNIELNSVATTTGPLRIGFNAADFPSQSPDQWGNGEIMYVSGMDHNCQCAVAQATVSFKITNLYTGEFVSNSVNNLKGNTQSVVFFSSQAPLFDFYQIDKGSFALTIDLLNPADIGGNTVICNSLRSFTWRLTPATTVQYISEVSTINSITAWGNFESVNQTNGGQINFYARTSTSSVNITTQVWSAITPGVVVPAPTINNYIQWATTITSVSSFTQSNSNIDLFSIDHIEGGGSVGRAFGITWKNRYWLFTTTTTGNLSLLYMKSKITNSNPDAWMPIEGINIASVAKDRENTLYGGSSSSGTFYRLDYGTNYDGLPIVSVYNTPDLYMNDLFNEKKLYAYYLTADEESNKTVKIGLSINGGDFTDTTYSVDGTGRTNKSIQNVAGTGKLFRWRFIQDQLDKGFGVTNFGVLNTNIGVRAGIGD